MANEAFTLRIFVADGDPDGLRIVERSNWVGKPTESRKAGKGAFWLAFWVDEHGASRKPRSGLSRQVAQLSGSTSARVPPLPFSEGRSWKPCSRASLSMRSL